MTFREFMWRYKKKRKRIDNVSESNADFFYCLARFAEKHLKKAYNAGYGLTMPTEKQAKWLYRLEAVDPENGLWYNSKNQYVWGCRDCKGEAKNLPMGLDYRYHIDGKNWFSSCSNIEDLLHWYSKEDAQYLLDNGFVFTRYLATDFHEFKMETVFLKETALKREVIDFISLFGDQQ